MRSPVPTLAAVPPLACPGRKGKPTTSFLPMLGIVLGWVLLLLLLLYCEAAIVVTYLTAVEMDSRIHPQMGLPHRDVDGRPLGSDGDKEDRLAPRSHLAGTRTYPRYRLKVTSKLNCYGRFWDFNAIVPSLGG